MRRIYLDTNILVCVFSTAAPNKPQAELVKQAFEVFAQLKDVEMTTSMWTITELIKVLIVNIEMESTKVSEIEKDLLNEGRFLGMKLRILDVSPKSDYDFKEFFYNIRKGILSNRSGVGDNIHCTIMRNHDVETILTFNQKDFMNIPKIIALNPKDVKI